MNPIISLVKYPFRICFLIKSCKSRLHDTDFT